MQNFRNIDAWHRAHALALRIHKLATRFPKEEIFGTTSHLRRTVVAVPTKIVQACGSDGVQFGQRMREAAGLTCDLEYAIILASDLGYLEAAEREALLNETVEIRRMLFGLLRTQ